MSAVKIVYNGITIGDTSQYYIDRLPGFYDINIRTSEDFLTDQDGSKIWNQKYASRELAIEGTLIGTTVADYFEKASDLAKAFSITKESKLLTITKWDDASTQKNIYAKVVSMPRIIEEVGQSNFAAFRIELKAETPFFLSTSSKSGSTAIGTATGIPLSIPMGIPIGSNTNGQITINNEGDIEAFPSFTISNDLQNPTVTNITTGEFFQIQDTLSIGDIVSVSVGNDGLRVTKNGTNIFDKFAGDIFTLAKGVNTIKFSATGSSNRGLLTVNFTDHYLTI
jgi:hypothetical protein